jgi:hypothetical protein
MLYHKIGVGGGGDLGKLRNVKRRLSDVGSVCQSCKIAITLSRTPFQNSLNKRIN